MLKNNKFISLLRDTTFKYLFKEEKYRCFYVDIIKYVCGVDLSDYYLVDNELNSGSGSIKDYRLDILLKKNDEDYISIEMNSNYADYILIRNLKYMYRLGSYNKSGEEYKINKILQINFNNWKCEYDENINTYSIMCNKDNIKDIKFSSFMLRDTDNDVLINGFNMINIYLPLYKDKCYNKEKEARYLAMFTASSYDEMEKYASSDEVALMVVEKLKSLANDEFFNYIYDQEDDFKSCMASERSEGYDEGREEGKIEDAKNMLDRGFSIEDISSITGLDEERINKIKEEL